MMMMTINMMMMIHEEFDIHSLLFDLSLGRNSYCPEADFWIVRNLMMKISDVVMNMIYFHMVVKETEKNEEDEEKGESPWVI